MAVYKSLNINIGTLKGNPEMLKFVKTFYEIFRLLKYYQDQTLLT